MSREPLVTGVKNMAAKNRFNPIDCLGSALPDEEYFVLLARDPAFPAMLAVWASLRVGNLKAASENFMLLMQPELVRHYQKHPDIAKSEEAIATAQRGHEWREGNLKAGPDGKPSWKSSLVRPAMMKTLHPSLEADQGLMEKIACGLRQVAQNMIDRSNRDVAVVNDDHGFDLEAHAQYADRINGYAAELEAALANPPILVIGDPPCRSLANDAAYLREKGRQMGYDQGGDKLIEIANRIHPAETHGDMS